MMRNCGKAWPTDLSLETEFYDDGILKPVYLYDKYLNLYGDFVESKILMALSIKYK